MFERLPHVGGVVSADEEERFHRLMDFLLMEMERRRELFGRINVATLKSYRDATSETLPAIVLIVDNYANLYDAYEDSEEGIIKLTRDGGNLGIHLVLTATNAATIRFRVSSNITQAVALNLVEKGDYSAIVGRTEVLPVAVKGRGLVRRTTNPLEFQTALPGWGDSDLERSVSLKKMMEMMAENWHGARAKPIPLLPEVVSLTEILQAFHQSESSDNNEDVDSRVPLGLDVKTLEPFSISLLDGPNFLITGPMQCGKTTLLYIISKILTPSSIMDPKNWTSV